ncbi:MAG: hypothetical protein AAF909_06775 [Pseudomonadota bacterium]
MRPRRLPYKAALAAALCLTGAPIGGSAGAQIPSAGVDKPGDVYELRLRRGARAASDGSSGSSRRGAVLLERVIAVGSKGVVLRLEPPTPRRAAPRPQDWRFPVEVLKRPDGGLELLNEADLEARIGEWLVQANLDRSAGGQWVFTWNVFKIECEPRSVLETLRPFDLRLPAGELTEGFALEEPGALGPARPQPERGGRCGTRFGAGSPPALISTRAC